MTLDHDFDPRLGSAFPGDKPTPTNAATIPDGGAPTTAADFSGLAARIREAHARAATGPGADHPETVPAPAAAGSGINTTPQGEAYQAPQTPSATNSGVRSPDTPNRTAQGSSEEPTEAEVSPRNWRRIGIIAGVTGLVAVIGAGTAILLNRGGDSEVSATGQGDTKASSLTTTTPSPAAAPLSANTLPSSATTVAPATPEATPANAGILAEKAGYVAGDLCGVVSPNYFPQLWSNEPAVEWCQNPTPSDPSTDIVTQVTWNKAFPQPGDRDTILGQALIRDDDKTIALGVTGGFDAFARASSQTIIVADGPYRPGYTIAYSPDGLEAQAKMGPYVLDVAGTDLDNTNAIAKTLLESGVIDAARS